MLFSPTGIYILVGALVIIIISISQRKKIGMTLRKNYTLWRWIIKVKKYWKLVSITIILLALLFVISALAIVWITYRANQLQSDTWLSLVRSPGTIFVFLMALVTALGFRITVQRINEINSRFTRYDDFLVRATELLQSEINRSAYEERTVQMLCTTPLAGNISERDTGYYKEYLDVLRKARNQLVLQIVHLPESKMREFYYRFQEEGRYSEEIVNDALQETERFLRQVEVVNRARSEQQAESPDVTVLPNHTIRHLWSEIGYRLIVCEDKALFFVPLYLPMESGPPGSTQSSDVRHRQAQKNLQVEMIGFETEEPSIVKQLIANFNHVSTRSPLAGAEYLREIQTPSGNLYFSAMHSISSFNIEDNQAILLVHGTTGSIEDKHWKKRLQFRDKASMCGFASYEFDYRGRGRDTEHAQDFSVDSAVEDLNVVLRHLFEQERHSKIWIVARGLGAYVSLASSEAKTRNCPLVLWQPIFHPDRTMAYRQHIQAYEQAYSQSEGHKYVEIENVRLHDAFFASLKNLTLPEALAWKGIQICIFYNQEDGVTKREWIDEFVTKLRDDNEKEAQIHYEIVGSDVRLNEMSVIPYIDKTIEFLKNPRWE